MRDSIYEAHPLIRELQRNRDLSDKILDAFSEYQPLTWRYNDRMLDDIELFEPQQFIAEDGKAHNVKWLFSDEMEFRLSEAFWGALEPDEAALKLEQSKLDIQQKLGEPKIIEALREIGTTTESASAQVDDFGLAECALFDIHYQLFDQLEFTFGKGEHGTGYYDNPDIVEIRLKPVAPMDYISNYHSLPDNDVKGRNTRGRVRAHGENSPSQSNELLEDNSHEQEWMDTGAPQEASRANQELATVEA